MKKCDRCGTPLPWVMGSPYCHDCQKFYKDEYERSRNGINQPGFKVKHDACQDCKFSIGMTGDDNVWRGQCHRFPPPFPRVDADEWCAEFSGRRP